MEFMNDDDWRERMEKIQRDTRRLERRNRRSELFWVFLTYATMLFGLASAVLIIYVMAHFVIKFW